MSPATLTRRRVLQTSLAAALLSGGRRAASQHPSAPRWILLGGSEVGGIYRASWNATTGEIGPAEPAVTTPQPTFLTLHPHLPVVYACNETDSVSTSAVSAFHLDRLSAHLHPLGTQPTHGAAPCFVSVDRTGNLLFAASYGGGNLAVFPLDGEGRPGPATTVFNCAGNSACGSGGPVSDRQGAPHLHCATISPGNRFVLACDLGDDAILAFPIHPRTQEPLGQLTRIPTAPGAGPRHLAFHPNGLWLYCINEINCTVSLFLWRSHGNTPTGEAVPAATATIRPPNAPQEPPSTGGEIALDRDGRFLYTSTRFSDVLTVFAVDPNHGRLTPVQQVPCGGKTPRFFALDPSEQWLVCANQDSNTLSSFSRDINTGRLTPCQTYQALNPECLHWI